MQFTRKTDYAIRCVYYLARHPDQVTVIGEIASRMKIPNSFLAKIMQKLARAGLVESHRGVKGGFTLSREPARISLYDVILAMEGPVVLNMCAVHSKECGLSATCSIHPFWVELRRDVEARLKGEDFATLTLSPAIAAAAGGQDAGR
ncbi:RrF2 family transcriptional regulator [Salinispira pacifica]